MDTETKQLNFQNVKTICSSIIVDLRYFGPYNFMGRVIDGYKSNNAILTKKAALALKEVQEDIEKDGYNLVLYEAFRPMRASMEFKKWSMDPLDNKMQKFFYPFIDKATLFDKGFIALNSSHSRGSTVDVSIIEIGQNLTIPKLTEIDLDDGTKIPFYDDGSVNMGTSFDYFGMESYTKHDNTPSKSKEYRQYLVKVMEKRGFKNTAPSWGDNPKEWWHFTLEDEPFPDEYFDFEVK